MSHLLLEPLHVELREDELAVVVSFIEAEDVPVGGDGEVGIGRRPRLKHPRHGPGPTLIAAQAHGQTGAFVGVARMYEQDALGVETNDVALAGGLGKIGFVFDLRPVLSAILALGEGAALPPLSTSHGHVDGAVRNLHGFALVGRVGGHLRTALPALPVVVAEEGDR